MLLCMNHVQVLSALALFVTILSPMISRAADDPLPVLEKLETRYQGLYGKYEETLKNLDSSIADGGKSGALKPSTVAYYNDLIAQLRALPRLPDTASVLFPPVFDTSPSMAPVNEAWAAVRSVVGQIHVDGAALNSEVAGPMAASIQEAALKAEVPEDLALAKKLYAFYNKVSHLGSRSGMSPHFQHEMASILSAMQVILDAKTKNDDDHFVSVLMQYANGPSRIPYPASAFSVQSGGSRADWEIFRNRMIKSYADREKDAAKMLESAIMQKADTATLESALAVWHKAADISLKVVENERNPRGSQYDIASRKRMYEEIIAHVSGKETKVLSYQYQNERWSSEFGKFINDLRAKSQPRFGANNDSAQDKWKMEQQEAQKRKAEVIQSLSKSLTAVQTPADLEKLIDDIQSRSNEPELEGIKNSIAHALREIELLWKSQNPRLDMHSQAYSQAGPLSKEISNLRQLVLRKLLAKKFDIPAITEAPATDVDVVSAVENLAAEAAEKGDWKKSLKLFRIVDSLRNDYNKKSTIIALYLSALALEEVEQFDQAVYQYLTVVKSIEDHTPTKEAAERIRALRKSHPEAFPKQKDPMP